MTDIAEDRYGYDPEDPASFPPVDFLASPDQEYPIANSEFNNARIIQTGTGINIKWDNNQGEGSYGRFSLTLNQEIMSSTTGGTVGRTQKYLILNLIWKVLKF